MRLFAQFFSKKPLHSAEEIRTETLNHVLDEIKAAFPKAEYKVVYSTNKPDITIHVENQMPLVAQAMRSIVSEYSCKGFSIRIKNNIIDQNSVAVEMYRNGYYRTTVGGKYKW